MMRWLSGAFVLMGLLFSLAYAGLLSYLETSVAKQSVEYRVEAGQTLRPILASLASQGLLGDPDVLYYYARFLDKGVIHQGYYRWGQGDTPLTILRDLRQGRVVTRELTIAEGLNRWQIGRRLQEEGWGTEKQFAQLCDDSELLAANHVPGPSCEGYLFPETYTFAKGTKLKRVVSVMFESYRRAYAAVSKSLGSGPLDLLERDFVTLASIVEKETGASHERSRIACVFYNRLRARPMWRLETDPTVIYAATLEDPQFDGNIRRYHLSKMKNPYNTYQHYGLPPGPIASPGRGAMEAVAKPETCLDYFFVSKNNGEHTFCPTLRCHRRAVKRWQIDFFRRRR